MLDAAQELVAEIGYDALTTTLIAERADVSIGSLYQFFPDKQAVVRAVALRNLELFSERLADGGRRSATVQLVGPRVLGHRPVRRHAPRGPRLQAIRFGDVADLHLLDPERDNDTVVADRFVELIHPSSTWRTRGARWT